jgi:hypothetical protein
VSKVERQSQIQGEIRHEPGVAGPLLASSSMIEMSHREPEIELRRPGMEDPEQPHAIPPTRDGQHDAGAFE